MVHIYKPLGNKLVTTQYNSRRRWVPNYVVHVSYHCALRQGSPNFGPPYIFIRLKNVINKCFKKLNENVSYYVTVYVRGSKTVWGGGGADGALGA
jgi:hypothetical protein